MEATQSTDSDGAVRDEDPLRGVLRPDEEQALGAAPAVLKHGAAAYRNLKVKCRCPVCRAANTEHCRLQRERRRQQEPLVHGASTYKNWMCRCRVCVLGHNEAIRQYRESKAS